MSYLTNSSISQKSSLQTMDDVRFIASFEVFNAKS